MRWAQKLVQTMRAKRTTKVMAAGTKDPALLLGFIVLQSFVVHLEMGGVIWEGKQKRRRTPSGLPYR